MLFRPSSLHRIGDRFVGPPDLVIEVLSPSTASIDRGEKMEEYARAGILEFWIIDPRGLGDFRLPA